MCEVAQKLKILSLASVITSELLHIQRPAYMSRNTLERMGALTQNCHLATACRTVIVHLHYRPQAATTLQNVGTHSENTISALKLLLTISQIQHCCDSQFLTQTTYLIFHVHTCLGPKQFLDNIQVATFTGLHQGSLSSPLHMGNRQSNIVMSPVSLQVVTSCHGEQ